MKKILSLAATLALAFSLVVTPAYADENSDAIKVSTADELIEALEAGNDVVFTDNIKIDPANMSNAYGATGINVKNGQAIDGAGYTLDIKGAGGTWDSGINTTGGLIKNLTVTGSFRGIFINHNSDYSELVILDNVTIDGTVYTISCDQGKNQGLIATNCTFNGWTSYAATLGDVRFVNCTFGEGNGYAYIRPYASTEFVDCTFEEGYEADPRAEVTLTNCYLGDTLLTDENMTNLFTSNENNADVVNMAAQIGGTRYPTLDAAIAAAKDGETVALLHDVEYTSQLQVHKAITLDLHGNTITTNFGWGGISLKNNCSLVNGTIIHNGAVTAIKVWNAEKLEDLNIQVTGQKNSDGSDKEIGGISVQASTGNYIESIKNVTITGATYGIETQYVGESTDPVIGTMENLTIKAKDNGLKLLAPSGTIKNSTIESDGIGINMFKKGLASVTLTVENCNITADTAVYLHDENFVDPNKINNGEISVDIDSDTTLTSADGKTLAFTEVGTTGKSEVVIEINEGICPVTGENGEVTYVASHTFDIVSAKDATCTEDGYTGDEVCKECGYINKTGEVINALGHTYKDGVCTECGDEKVTIDDSTGSVAPTPEKDPTKTSDNSNIALFAGLAVLAAGAMFVLRRKEEF